MLRAALFLLLLAATTALLVAIRPFGSHLSPGQIESAGLFGGMVWGMILYERHRLVIASAAVAGVLACRLLPLRGLAAAAGLDVILFLLGVFLVAAYLEESLFFDHLAAGIARRVGPRPLALMAALVLAAMASSALVGEEAAILFVGGAMLQIADRYRFPPIPFLIMLVFAVNTGSAASPFGPVGVIIALRAHLSVRAFFRWPAPIALVAIVPVFLIGRWRFAAEWAGFARAIRGRPPAAAPADPAARSAGRGWVLAASLALGLILHGPLGRCVGLSEQASLVGVSLAAGAAALALCGRGAGSVLRRRVDWGTLAFLLMLFLAAGALQATGITALAARGVIRLIGGRPASLALLVGWSTGLTGAFLPNLLDVVAYLPVIAQLRAQGAACPTAIYWMMLFGATFMGNLTPMGSTSNLIACGLAKRRGYGVIGFGPWLRVGALVSFVSMALGTLLLAAQTGWLTRG